MKKSTLIMILSLVLAVALGVGGTLAYLTDTEDDINVMTVGKVDIDLIEQQRDGNGGLEPFEDGKVLLPLVGSAQGEKDEMGMPTASNYVDKIISVSNKNASSDAWVRLLVGFPVDMEREGTANGPLHWNLGNKFTGVDDQYDAAGWSEDWELVETEETFEHDGIKYKVYAFNYKHILAPGAETDTAAVTGFYLDSRVDWDDETNEYFMYIDGVKKTVSGMAADGSVYIPVVAQAVQASGFETYEEAFETAALPINPWVADESLLDEIPVLVSNTEELAAALEEAAASGEPVIIKMEAGTYTLPSMSKYDNVTLVGSGENTVIEPTKEGGTILSSTLKDLTFVNMKLDAGSGNVLRWAYTAEGKTVTFKNCELIGEGYTVHFDGGKGSLAFDNCKMTGWMSYGKIAGATFDDCEFYADGVYGIVRAYADTTFTNCTFDFDAVDTTDKYQDGVDATEGVTVTMVNCTNVNGDVKDLFEAEDIAGTDGIVVIK